MRSCVKQLEQQDPATFARGSFHQPRLGRLILSLPSLCTHGVATSPWPHKPSIGSSLLYLMRNSCRRVLLAFGNAIKKEIVCGQKGAFRNELLAPVTGKRATPLSRASSFVSFLLFWAFLAASLLKRHLRSRSNYLVLQKTARRANDSWRICAF